MSSTLDSPGKEASMLGIAARKECLVIWWFSSVKSPNKLDSMWFTFLVVKNFVFGKQFSLYKIELLVKKMKQPLKY